MNEDIRNESINLINKFVKNKRQSKVIENSIYNYILENISYDSTDYTDDNVLDDISKNLYYFKVNTIVENLNPKSSIKNNYLLKAIKSKDIDLHNIANLENFEIFPDKWKDIISKETENERCRKLISTTDEFKCGNCKKNKCIFVEKQTRSADEPMTLFIECQFCHNRWKQ